MLADLDFDACCERLEPLLAAWSDIVVPQAFESPLNTSYKPAYAWMHAYERQLRKRVEAIMKTHFGTSERTLFGADGAFSEALSNAFLHGHRRDPRLPIRVSCAVGLAGVAFAIHDEGPGFDPAAVAAKAERGGTYFRVAGNGFRALTGAGVLAGYSDGGRTLALLFEFPAP
jgi:anti-sigma regulatory factor (Ser/Thr protein kinase)